MLKELWKRSLAGGDVGGRGENHYLGYVFSSSSHQGRLFFVWDDIRFELVSVPHVNYGAGIMPTYGLLLRFGQTTIFYTTDT